MARLSKATRLILEQQHLFYRHILQEPCQTDQRLVALGHPFTRDYLALRRRFDRLRYAANARARFYSFQDQGECAVLWAPSLSLSLYPSGPLAAFGHVYPAHAQWEAYLTQAKAVGWDGAGVVLDGGGWDIYTRLPELDQALHTLLQDWLSPDVARSCRRWDAGNGVVVYRIHLFAQMSPALHGHLVNLLKHHHAHCVLPRRTARFEAEDRVPLTLAQKPLVLANVAEVEEGPHAIKVPLLPPDAPSLRKRLQPIVRQLKALFERGYPFTQAEHWLREVLMPEEFVALAERYGHATKAASGG